MRNIAYMFGNPGSTELPLLIQFPEDRRYVLALQESIAVAMADGCAQASRAPALINLHVAPGLGNAMGVLFTALKNNSPLIVTCGQQDTRHMFHEPLLSGDLVSIARPVTKWSYEVKTPDDVIPALEQAYLLAMTPPRGPVFLSIPMNFWDSPADTPTLRQLNPPSAPQGLEQVADALSKSQSPAMVVGAQVDAAGGFEAAVALAEKLKCAVFSAPLNSRAGFPTSHPLFKGMLLPAAPRIFQALMMHDVVLVVGAPLFTLYPYFAGRFTPATAQVFHITEDPMEASRAPATAAFVGDLRLALENLGSQVSARNAPVPSRAAEEAKRRSEAARLKPKMGARYVLHLLARQLSPDTVIVDESISSSLCLREFIPIQQSGGYYTSASGGLGWAMPAAVGVKLAQPERPVVCVIGDGSSMYSIQALWTAAQEKAKVTYVVLNNSGYNILKSFTRAFYPGSEVPGLDVPTLDLVAVAQGMGVPAECVQDPDGVEEAIARALASDTPTLLDVHVDKTVPNLF